MKKLFSLIKRYPYRTIIVISIIVFIIVSAVLGADAEWGGLQFLVRLGIAIPCVLGICMVIWLIRGINRTCPSKKHKDENDSAPEFIVYMSVIIGVAVTCIIIVPRMLSLTRGSDIRMQLIWLAVAVLVIRICAYISFRLIKAYRARRK